MMNMIAILSSIILSEVHLASAVSTFRREEGYDRGVGVAANQQCGDGYVNGNAEQQNAGDEFVLSFLSLGATSTICYENCPSTHYGYGAYCWEHCPSGSVDTGAQCQFEAHSIGKIDTNCGAYYNQACPENWEKTAICTCVAPSGCPAGYADLGHSCYREPYLHYKNSFARDQYTAPLQCPDGQQLDGGLCYENCRPGFRGTATRCYP
eukprot:Awhi_evm1s5766